MKAKPVWGVNHFDERLRDLLSRGVPFEIARVAAGAELTTWHASISPVGWVTWCKNQTMHKIVDLDWLEITW